VPFSSFTRQISNLNRLVRRLSQEAAEASGLTLNQAVLLVRLQRQSCTMSELKHELDVTTGAVTGLVDRLERLGLVRRVPCQEDRRVVNLELAPAGAEASERFMTIWERKVDEWLARVPEAERAQVEPVLKALLDAGSEL
jgi:DNA-binding MarR family transcriptional regulator